MKRPNPEEFRDTTYADLFYWMEFAKAMEVYADYKDNQANKLESQNKQMYEALKAIVRTNNDTDNSFEVLRKVIFNFSKLLNQIENDTRSADSTNV